MKKILFGLLIPASFGIVSCKKDSATAAPTVKFMSFTAGSSWNYKVTNDPSSTTPTTGNYTVTATSGDTSANSKTYSIFTNSTGPNEYYNITGSDYYTFRALPATLADTSIEVLYLKDNLNAGATWSQSVPINVSGFPLTLVLTNKIVQKGISRTVNGIAYTDVTDIETVLTVQGIPPIVTYSLTSDIHYYYTPKVGQIENKTKIDFIVSGFDPIHFDQKTELQSSTIL